MYSKNKRNTHFFFHLRKDTTNQKHFLTAYDMKEAKEMQNSQHLIWDPEVLTMQLERRDGCPVLVTMLDALSVVPPMSSPQ